MRATRQPLNKGEFKEMPIKTIYMKEEQDDKLKETINNTNKLPGVNLNESKLIGYCIFLANFNMDELSKDDLRKSINDYFEMEKKNSSISSIVDKMFYV